jgi:hypothetical protein
LGDLGHWQTISGLDKRNPGIAERGIDCIATLQAHHFTTKIIEQDSLRLKSFRLPPPANSRTSLFTLPSMEKEGQKVAGLKPNTSRGEEYAK